MPILNTRLGADGRDAQGNPVALPSNMALAHRGPVLAVTLRPLELQRQAMVEQGQDMSPGVQGVALIDTGASQTCVDESAARAASIAVVGRGPVASASHDAHEVPIFAGQIEVAGLGAFNAQKAFGVNILNSQGIVALIGRDALQAAVFIYNGPDGSFSLSL